MLFQVTQVYEKEDMAAYYDVASKNPNVDTEKAQGSFCFLMLYAAMALTGLAIYIVVRSLKWLLLFVPVLVAVLAAIGLLTAAYVLVSLAVSLTRKQKVEHIWANYPSKGEELTITFEETGFVQRVSYYESHFQYPAISIIMEDASHYFLVLHNHTFMILCKSSFAQGDPTAFGSFIRQKRQEALISAMEHERKECELE